MPNANSITQPNINNKTTTPNVHDNKLDSLINIDVSRIHNNLNDSKNLDASKVEGTTEKRAKEKEKLWEDKRQKVYTYHCIIK